MISTHFKNPFALMLRLRPPFALSLSKGERLGAQHNGLSKGERLDAQHKGLSKGLRTAGRSSLRPRRSAPGSEHGFDSAVAQFILSLSKDSARTVLLILFFAFAAGTSGAALAQRYPDKPIRLVVGSAPGGGTDFVARVTNAKLSELLGKQVIIDNRGGAGGLLGSEIVAQAPADGYTLLQIFSNFAILPSLHPKLSFDVEKDFAAVVNVATSPLILVVHPGVPANSVSELIAHARAQKGALNFAAPGVGSLGHLAGELFKSTAKVDMAHVAYKGGGPSIAALVSKEVHLYFSTVPAALTQVKAGRLRALGVTSSKRSSAAPQVPTIAEQGLGGFEVVGWFGMFAPARTPASVIALLNQSVNKTIASPEVKERLVAEGVEPAGGTPAEFAAQVKQDIKKWNAVAKQAGVKPGQE